MLLGIGLVLFVWKRQEKTKTETNTRNAADLERLYNFLVQSPDGVSTKDITALLLVDENQAGQYVAQLEAQGIVRQFAGPGGAALYALNKDSEFNRY